ncbi:uncharacterized protein N7500_008771 [Penicillium coprophilum]|nr:uncharacterized protein N7500_008771 [Penicillium coprophilum]KAJ5159120.1 hypothetical protein N7500_008771 [Penicillium coprophilum]
MLFFGFTLAFPVSITSHDLIERNNMAVGETKRAEAPKISSTQDDVQKSLVSELNKAETTMSGQPVTKNPTIKELLGKLFGY